MIGAPTNKNWEEDSDEASIEVPWRVQEIWVSPGHDYWTRGGENRLSHGNRSVDRVRCEASRGLVGDRYFDDRPGDIGVGRRCQVTFMDAAVIQSVRERFRLPHLPASVFRRNIIVATDANHPLARYLGRTFKLQGVEFEGAQECTPCHWMDRVVDEGCQAYLREAFRGGLRCRIRSSGDLTTTP